MARASRKLCIVARNEPRLHEDLVERFSRDEGVEVIIDRRVGKRRRQDVPTLERRQVDGRRRHSIHAQLRTVGHALVEVDAAPEALEGPTPAAIVGTPPSAVTDDARRFHRCPSCLRGSVIRDARSNRRLERALLRLIRRRAYVCLDCGSRFYDRPISRRDSETDRASGA